MDDLGGLGVLSDLLCCVMVVVISCTSTISTFQFTEEISKAERAILLPLSPTLLFDVD